jgi:hypothetical protein
VIKNQCLGTDASMGGAQGGMRRGRKAVCPVCGRKIRMRPGRAGRLYPHKAEGKKKFGILELPWGWTTGTQARPPGCPAQHPLGHILVIANGRPYPWMTLCKSREGVEGPVAVSPTMSLCRVCAALARRYTNNKII